LGGGAVVDDYDNHGWPDIYVSNFGKNRLYRHFLAEAGFQSLAGRRKK
jgi:hypothetical protein